MNKLTPLVLVLLTLGPLVFGESPTSTESQMAALMAFERDIEAATAKGDVTFLSRALAEDFVFTHGDAWRTGSTTGRVDTKASWLDVVRQGPFASREVTSQQVEPHGSLVITTGRIVVKLKPPSLNAGKAEYSIWFVRVYRAKGGGWELVSHRTVAESAA